MFVTSAISVKLTIYKIHTLSENYLSVCLYIYIYVCVCVYIYIYIYIFYTKRHCRSVKSMDLTKFTKIFK